MLTRIPLVQILTSLAYIAGVATGLIFVSLLCLPSEQSTAGGLFQTALNIGNAFGTGMATLVYTSVAQRTMSGTVNHPDSSTLHGGYTQDALLKGLKVGFWVSCGLALIGKWYLPAGSASVNQLTRFCMIQHSRWRRCS
jgi:hypothetical protein